jgi:hypothetical protein
MKVLVQSGIGLALIPAGAADNEASLGMVNALPFDTPRNAFPSLPTRPDAGFHGIPRSCTPRSWVSCEWNTEPL